MIARAMIYQALRKIGQQRPGYQASPELMADALTEFQILFDGFNATRTAAFSIPDYILPIGSLTGLNGIYGQNVQFSLGPTFTVQITTVNTSTTATCANTAGLNIGQSITGSGIPASTYITAVNVNTSIVLSAAATASASITASIPATFNIPRPEDIIKANWYLTSTSPTQPTRYPLTRLSVEEWASISVIQINPVNVSIYYYYDPQYPQGVLNIWPPVNGNSIELFTWGFLTPPTLLTTEMRLPPGYQDWIIWSLAERMYPMATRAQMVNRVSFGYIVNQRMIAEQRVRDQNAPHPKLSCDFRGGSSYANVGVADWEGLLTGNY